MSDEKNEESKKVLKTVGQYDKDKSKDNDKGKGLLVPQEKYLEAGCHIGTKFKTGSMRDFIYRRRKDRLFVMDISKIDKQIRKAAELMAKYDPQDITITAVRMYAGAAGAKMSLILGTKLIPKRFVPGTFTNPNIKYFREPKLLLVCDPRAEGEAVREAKMMKIPVIGLCDTENETKNIDVVVPCNNKGKRSLALIFYILTREYMMKKGMISSYSEFKYRPRDFENLDSLNEYKKHEEEIEHINAEVDQSSQVPIQKEQQEQQGPQEQTPTEKTENEKNKVVVAVNSEEGKESSGQSPNEQEQDKDEDKNKKD